MVSHDSASCQTNYDSFKCTAQVAELGGENEQLQWQLTSAQQKQQQAELTVQQYQSDRLASTSDKTQAQSGALPQQLEQLGRQNSELQSELAAAKQNLKAQHAEEAQRQQDQQQHKEKSDRLVWELEHSVDNLTQENKSLLAHHSQLETRFDSLTKQLAKAQHAQHAGAQSKVDQAETLARASALQEQVSNLMQSSAVQVEQRHRLENEVATLQRKLTGAESALGQHQHRVRGQREAETASSSKIAMLQQQAEDVVEENAALQGQCRQQSADMKRLQSDVQVSMHIHICTHTHRCLQV